MRKESITVSLDEGVIYNEIFTNTNALNSMLLTTGYLTMSDYPEPSLGDFLCTMRIPNQEILFLFKREIMNHIDSIGTDNALTNNLLSSLLTGKAEEFAAALNEYLMLMASFYDTAKRESFYHGLMLGLLATLIPRYEVVSNRESGYGRFDLAVFPAATNPQASSWNSRLPKRNLTCLPKLRKPSCKSRKKNTLPN